MASRKRARPRNRRRRRPGKGWGQRPSPWLLRALVLVYVLLALGELAPWIWLGAVCLEVRPYLLLPLWGLTAVALRQRVGWALGPALVATLVGLSPFWTWLRPVSGAPSRGPEARILTQGLSGWTPDRQAFARWLRAADADVVVLTGVSPAPGDRIRSRAGYRAWTVRPERGTRLTLMSRLPVVQPPVRGKDGAVRARFRVDACVLSLTALRAPRVWNAALAAERRRLFERLSVNRKQEARVWAGDFGSELNAPGPAALMERAQLADSRRGFGRNATWPAILGSFGLAMDHVLVGGWIAVRDRSAGPRLEGAGRRPAMARLQLTSPDCARAQGSPGQPHRPRSVIARR